MIAKPPPTKSLNTRLNGLDSIRFICSMWVVLGHLGYFPLLEGIDTSSKIGRIMEGAYGTIISGPAAVIIFFLISGLCIHYPHRNGKKPQWASYYLRRYIRISLPLIGAMLIAGLFDTGYSLVEETVLWSIAAELIYYTIYPAILQIKKHIGWNSFIVIAFVLAYLVTLLNPDAGNYPSYTIKFNWLLGLPCWLLGCKLAEKADSLVPQKNNNIWQWRIGLWAISCLCLILRFHTPVGYPYTLNLFAIAAYFWLEKEISYFREYKPSRWLELGGKWSYSIYLMHLPAAKVVELIDFPNLGYILNWSILILGVTIVSYLFYLIVELPSHRLAQKMKNF